LQIPEFDAAYRKARRDAFSQSIARLQQASSAAVATLLKVMVDEKTPASSKLRAADCILGYAAKAIELADFEARLAALERAKAEEKKENGSCSNLMGKKCELTMKKDLLRRLDRLEQRIGSIDLPRMVIATMIDETGLAPGERVVEDWLTDIDGWVTAELRVTSDPNDQGKRCTPVVSPWAKRFFKA